MRRILVIFILSLPLNISATTMLFMEIEDIVRRSEVIIRGTVKDVISRYNDERTKIFTYSVIEAKEVFKGKVPPVITVRTYGGQVGDVIMKVPGMPEFKKGEEVFIFVKPNEDFWHITGMLQGKYTIIKDENKEEVVVNNLKDVSFKKANENNKLEDYKPADLLLNLRYTDFTNKIKNIIQAHGNKNTEIKKRQLNE